MRTEIKLTFHTEEAMKSIDQSASKRMLEAVNEVRTTTLDTLSGNRTGRKYKVPGTKKIYTASAPGEPPAQATGRLRKSIKTSIEGEGKKEIVGKVGTDLDYGEELEFGTTKVLPRPWLNPSFERSRNKVKDILGGTWF